MPASREELRSTRQASDSNRTDSKGPAIRGAFEMAENGRTNDKEEWKRRRSNFMVSKIERKANKFATTESIDSIIFYLKANDRKAAIPATRTFRAGEIRRSDRMFAA